MVETIMENLYRIEVPLPNSPLKELNSYVIKGDKRNLVIDTGFNRETCFKAMTEGLSFLNIDLSKTDFFITHMHADHAGLVARLATDTSTIYFSKIDSRVYRSEDNWRLMLDYAGINGFPAGELADALKNHPGLKYSPRDLPEFTLVHDGDVITVGDFRLQCLWTPGHTQGHICLFDEGKRLLFSGDHVLYDITPHIESWAYQINSLRDYMTSLDRVYDLPVDLVLPGHRSLFSDLKGRIDELKEHHRHRAGEVLTVMDGRAMAAYEIAAGMTWDIDCEQWEDFPIAQKWFATGETIAHLRYLESEGKINRNAEGAVVTFSAL
ncbi:MAG TPA: MBL fold metallo-hydrolase [Deltaproteobacteria bacterium]|nr:MBL fold metallo-hydrolase [Deltaproteobacteria bacterium]